MNIQILGPGAVGTLLGGLLRLKGNDVCLRGKNAAPERGRVLRVVLPDKWLLVEGMQMPGPEPSGEDWDLFLITLGRHHLHALRRPDLARIIGTGDAPVAVFNCDPFELERLAVPRDRLRLCLSLMTAVKLQEG